MSSQNCTGERGVSRIFGEDCRLKNFNLNLIWTCNIYIEKCNMPKNEVFLPVNSETVLINRQMFASSPLLLIICHTAAKDRVYNIATNCLSINSMFMLFLVGCKP